MLFERHVPAVRRYLQGVFGDAVEAAEATQKTFVRAHSRLDAVHSAKRLRAWLFGIAHRVFLEQCRKRSTALETAALAEAEPAAVAPSPELELLGREAEAVLAAAIARLGAERRSALLLRLDQHLDYGAIAEEMGWPPDAKLKNEINRARRRSQRGSSSSSSSL